MAAHRIVFALGLIVYVAVAVAVAAFLCRRRGERRYAVAWGWLLAGSSAWVILVVARWLESVRQFPELLAEPHDAWGLSSFFMFLVFVWLSPLPFAMAALCAFPRGAWWRRVSVGSALAVEAMVLVALHVACHHTFTVTVLDQFGQPVANAEIWLSGFRGRVTDRDGTVKVSFYGRDRNLAIGSAWAPGHVINSRRASYGPPGPGPRRAVLRAWRLSCERLVLRSHVAVPGFRPEGDPYYFNLLRAEAGQESLWTNDLVISSMGAGAGAEASCPWRLRIRVPDGGVQIAPEGYRLLAPERGYEPSWRGCLERGRYPNEWAESFYLTLRGGKAFAVAEIGLRQGSELDLYVDAKVNPVARRTLDREAGEAGAASAWLRTLYGEAY